MTRGQKWAVWLCLFWGIVLLAMVGCKTSQNSKLQTPNSKLPLPMPPAPPTNAPAIKRAAVKAGSQAGQTIRTGWQRPDVLGQLVITNLVATNGVVTIGWSGAGTNQVLWAATPAGPWLPFGFPTTGHSMSLPMPASCAVFRIVDRTGQSWQTNRLDLGALFLDSQFVDASNGVSAFIAHDIFTAVPYLVTYSRKGVVQRYVIPGVVPNDLYSGGEVALLGGEVLVTTVNTLTAQARVIEYSFDGNSLTMTNSILTGDTASRTPDILKVSDGSIMVAFAEQGAGLYGWFLHRDPSGAWFDDGPMDLGSANAGELTVVLRLFERPSGGCYTVALKDSGGFLRISKLELHPKGSNVSTNFDLVNNDTRDGQLIYGHAAIHGEIPYSMVAKVDGANGRVLFTYVNEDLCYTTNADPDLRLSMARVVTTAWNADNSWSIALLSPDPSVAGATCCGGFPVAINQGATERVYGFYNVSLDPLAMLYVPLTQSADQTYPFYSPLTRYDGSASRKIAELSGYQNGCHHRVYSDAVGTDPSGHIFVVVNP